MSFEQYDLDYVPTPTSSPPPIGPNQSVAIADEDQELLEFERSLSAINSMTASDFGVLSEPLDYHTSSGHNNNHSSAAAQFELISLDNTSLQIDTNSTSSSNNTNFHQSFNEIISPSEHQTPRPEERQTYILKQFNPATRKNELTALNLTPTEYDEFNAAQEKNSKNWADFQAEYFRTRKEQMTAVGTWNDRIEALFDEENDKTGILGEFDYLFQAQDPFKFLGDPLWWDSYAHRHGMCKKRHKPGEKCPVDEDLFSKGNDNGKSNHTETNLESAEQADLLYNEIQNDNSLCGVVRRYEYTSFRSIIAEQACALQQANIASRLLPSQNISKESANMSDQTNFNKYTIVNESIYKSVLSVLLSTDSYGNSCLHWLVLYNEFIIINELIEQLYHRLPLNLWLQFINLSNKKGESPLHWCAYKSNLPILKLLLEYGGVLSLFNTTLTTEQNIVHILCKNGDVLLLDFLYKHYMTNYALINEIISDINAYKNGTFLETANNRANTLQTVKKRQDEDVNQISVVDATAIPPQHLIIPVITMSTTTSTKYRQFITNYVDIYYLLNTQKTKKNTEKLKDEKYLKITHFFALYYNITHDISRFTINTPDKHGKTPLHWCIYNNHILCTQWLLSLNKNTPMDAPQTNKLNMFMLDNEQCYPLHWVGLKGNVDVVDLYIDYLQGLTFQDVLFQASENTRIRAELGLSYLPYEYNNGEDFCIDNVALKKESPSTKPSTKNHNPQVIQLLSHFTGISNSQITSLLSLSPSQIIPSQSYPKAIHYGMAMQLAHQDITLKTPSQLCQEKLDNHLKACEDITITGMGSKMYHQKLSAPQFNKFIKLTKKFEHAHAVLRATQSIMGWSYAVKYVLYEKYLKNNSLVLVTVFIYVVSLYFLLSHSRHYMTTFMDGSNGDIMTKVTLYNSNVPLFSILTLFLLILIPVSFYSWLRAAFSDPGLISASNHVNPVPNHLHRVDQGYTASVQDVNLYGVNHLFYLTKHHEMMKKYKKKQSHIETLNQISPQYGNSNLLSRGSIDDVYSTQVRDIEMGRNSINSVENSFMTNSLDSDDNNENFYNKKYSLSGNTKNMFHILLVPFAVLFNAVSIIFSPCCGVSRKKMSQTVFTNNSLRYIAHYNDMSSIDDLNDTTAGYYTVNDWLNPHKQQNVTHKSSECDNDKNNHSYDDGDDSTFFVPEDSCCDDNHCSDSHSEAKKNDNKNKSSPCSSQSPRNDISPITQALIDYNDKHDRIKLHGDQDKDEYLTQLPTFLTHESLKQSYFPTILRYTALSQEYNNKHNKLSTIEQQRITNTSLLNANQQLTQNGPNNHYNTNIFNTILNSAICISCQIERPVRSKHCKEMKGCILRFDHFCPFLNNAVGEYNYRYFIFWLLSVTVLILIFQAMSVMLWRYLWSLNFLFLLQNVNSTILSLTSLASNPDILSMPEKTSQMVNVLMENAAMIFTTQQQQSLNTSKPTASLSFTVFMYVINYILFFYSPSDSTQNLYDNLSKFVTPTVASSLGDSNIPQGIDILYLYTVLYDLLSPVVSVLPREVSYYTFVQKFYQGLLFLGFNYKVMVLLPLFLIIQVVIILILFNLLSFHITLILQGLTTNEMINKHRYYYLQYFLYQFDYEKHQHIDESLLKAIHRKKSSHSQDDDELEYDYGSYVNPFGFHIINNIKAMMFGVSYDTPWLFQKRIDKNTNVRQYTIIQILWYDLLFSVNWIFTHVFSSFFGEKIELNLQMQQTKRRTTQIPIHDIDDDVGENSDHCDFSSKTDTDLDEPQQHLFESNKKAKKGTYELIGATSSDIDI